MTKELIIIALLVLVIYYWKQNQAKEQSEPTQTNQDWTSFLKSNLNSNSLAELKTKLNNKTLVEILEQNEDYETEVDALTRSKNSLEQDLTAQANAFQSRIREKDRELKKLKEDLKGLEKRHQAQSQNLTSEKQQHKGSLERIKLLTEQITNLEKEKASLAEQLKKIPGEFPPEPKEGSPELEKFITWAQEHEEFAKVDWDYYRTQEDWEKSFRKWNSLRADRISLLEEWKENNA